MPARELLTFALAAGNRPAAAQAGAGGADPGLDPFGAYQKMKDYLPIERQQQWWDELGRGYFGMHRDRWDWDGRIRYPRDWDDVHLVMPSWVHSYFWDNGFPIEW